jgi:signal transduction histidine kinase
VLEHELRGTVGAIAGLVRLLGEGRVPEVERAQLIASLQNAAGRASAIVSDIGQLARWSRAADEPREPEVFLTLLEKALRSESDADQIVLHTELSSDVRVPVIDADAVVRALAAVAGAARRSSGAGVTCQVRSHPAEVEVVLGPAAGWLAKTEQQPMDTSRGGLGLSVLLAAAIVNAHGGRLFQDASGVVIGVCLPLTATT